MEGAHLGAGAVASIEGIAHPITAARLVMEDEPCSASRTVRRQICATFQTRSASFHRRASPPLLRTDSREEKRSPTERHGTVGAVALDRSGRWRRASTGGIDSMSPGAGWRQPAHRLWSLRGQSEWCCVDDRNGGGIIRLVIAKSICDRLASGRALRSLRAALRMPVSRSSWVGRGLVRSPYGRIAIRHVNPIWLLGGGTGPVADRSRKFP